MGRPALLHIAFWVGCVVVALTAVLFGVAGCDQASPPTPPTTGPAPTPSGVSVLWRDILVCHASNDLPLPTTVCPR